MKMKFTTKHKNTVARIYKNNAEKKTQIKQTNKQNERTEKKKNDHQKNGIWCDRDSLNGRQLYGRKRKMASAKRRATLEFKSILKWHLQMPFAGILVICFVVFVAVGV